MNQAKRFWLFSIGFLLIVGFLMIWVYVSETENIKRNELQLYHQGLDQRLSEMMEAKMQATLGLAVLLSKNQRVIESLKSSRSLNRSEYEALTASLKTHTRYQNAWIQLIDAKGVSRVRSWTDKKEDSLISVRRDLVRFLQAPKVTTSFSVGKFTLSFKAMVPVYDGDRFLGSVEIISQVSSITKRLMEKSIHSVVLVLPEYKQQLTHSIAKKFIDDFYVVNLDVREGDLESLKASHFTQWIGKRDFRLFDGQFVSVHSLYNNEQNLLGYWVMFQPKALVSLHNSELVGQSMLYIFAAILALLLLLIMTIYYRRKALEEKHFFFDVFNSSTEVIYITDRQEIKHANARFFQLFNEFDSLPAFHETYECVCDTFLAEDGYLTERVDGVYWLDYILKHPEKEHFAKIKRETQDRIFLVKAVKVVLQSELSFSVLMTDVTEAEQTKQALEALSTRDALTGIYNRYYFNKVLNAEIERTHRYATPLSLLMFDIDFFKSINDTYGHDVGDKVLVAVVKRIQATLRETDVFCRVGGEEFIVIMPQTDVEQAWHTAERLQQTLAEMGAELIPHPVTVSIGVVSLALWEDFEHVFKRLDQALYQAKQNGRNRIEKG